MNINESAAAREAARKRNGRFGEQEHSAPEISLTQLNSFAEHFDRDLDARPMRPYLPLQASDDDEFFDAPPGAILEVVNLDGLTHRYQLGEGFQWTRIPDGEKIPSGELWSRLTFSGGPGNSVLHAPDGWLIGDSRFWARREDVDTPLSTEGVAERLHGKSVRVVSQAWSASDTGTGGRIDPSDHGVLAVTVLNDYAAFHGSGFNVRSFPIGNGEYGLFDREGDIVFRNSPGGNGSGLAVDFVYRVEP